MHELRNRPSRFSRLSCKLLSPFLLLSFLTPTLTTLAAAKEDAELRTFVVETTPVDGGAELLTIFGKFTFSGDGATPSREEQIPLVSVLRDTLGDATAENDRLRYVWMFTYTRPGLKKSVASSVPFLYANVGSSSGGRGEPPPLLDMAAAERQAWHLNFRALLFRLLVDSRQWYVRATTRAYRRNAANYTQVHALRALAILSLLEDETIGQPQVFSDAESRQIQARLMLAEQSLGGFVEDRLLERVYQRQTTRTHNNRGHNWELLRQRAEAEHLYFEPIEMPDGSATHALLWVAKADLAANHKRPYNSRFLAIADPWNDRRLRNWKGFSQTRYLDAENRLLPVEAELESETAKEAAPDEAPPESKTESAAEPTSEPTSEPVAEPLSESANQPATTAPNAAREAMPPNAARAIEMIPLALYGLDHPKIPILLVDFRDGFNPKKREASRRVLNDIARDIFFATRFGDVRYLLARAAYDFVTSRRGADLNQPSRMRAYSQLKLLLSISDALDPELKEEVNDRLERVSLNPLENRLQDEIVLANAQYEALMAYARRPDGLPAKLRRDRGMELSEVLNGKWKKAFYGLGSLFTWGKYEHRERVTDVRLTRLGVERQVAYHKEQIRAALRAGTPLEIAWDIDQLRRSLRFITENSAAADAQTVRLAEQVFAQTADEETRQLSLLCFYRINKESAKAALLRIYKDERQADRWRAESVAYLRKAMSEQQRIAPAVAREINGALD